MLITLITVCFNGGDTVRTTIDSVLMQSYPEIEYVVIDGGSTDGTVDILREYEMRFLGRMRWISEPDHGMYDAINKGIQMATGDVVGILNADDVLASPSIVAKIAQAFCHHEIQAVYGDVRFVSPSSPMGVNEVLAQPSVRYYSSRYYCLWMTRFGYMPAHPTFYCRKACFFELGSYKIDYAIAADHELMVRFLVKAGIRAEYLREVFVVMRLGGKSTASIHSTWVLNRENIRACRENGIYTNAIFQLGKYVVKIPGLLFRNGY